MMLKDESWMAFFSSRTLYKGYDYYLSDRVESVRKTKNGYEAVVDGSESYDVEIEIEDGCVTYMDCTCPYSADGNYCKHEAAVLYYIEEDIDGDACERNANDENDDIERIVSKMSDNDIRKLLVSLAKDDSDIRQMIYYHDDGVSPHLLEAVRADAVECIRRLNRAEYYEENRILNLLHEMENLLDGKISELLSKKRCAFEVFTLVSDLHEMLPWRELYDNGYDCASDTEDCFSLILADAYRMADEKDKEKIVREAHKRKAESHLYRNFLIYTVHDKEEAGKYLSELETIDYESFLAPIDEMISLMEILEYSEDRIISWMRDHLDNSRVCSLLPQRLYAAGLWQDAISTLHEIKEKYGFLYDGKTMLKKIYRDREMKDELKAMLLDEIRKSSRVELGDIKELRTLVSQSEWDSLCAEFKTLDFPGTLKPEFLDYINDYDTLMDYVENNPISYTSVSYCPKLLERFPARVIAVYEKNADYFASGMSNRNGYAYYASWLIKMSQTEEGMKKAQKKAAEIKAKYPRHRALHDELKKAGF